MIKKLYAANYPQRREETFLRAAGRCENILAGKERCPTKLGDWRITHSKQLQFEQLIIHHPNGDPENPDAVMIAICWSCHMRLHRRPGPGRTKASARKTGYEVIRVPHLMELLRCSGFSTWSLPEGGIGWKIDALCGEACDSIDAVAVALHWMSSEILFLQEQLSQTASDSTLTLEERDLITRRRDAEYRRASDRALREERTHPRKGALAHAS
ncbi:MAG TPA: hypothetical protein VFN35_17525 [Ktedonobacteraceae bacterium]|nr:hypothetical protein [Ktedonobacteraceae bacterium]